MIFAYVWNYLKWCWRCKAILPWAVRLVDDRELTQEEYEYPSQYANERNIE